MAKWASQVNSRLMFLQAFVPYSNASTTNETARYEDSHVVHTGQFFNTDLLNTYVRTATLLVPVCSSPLKNSSCQSG